MRLVDSHCHLQADRFAGDVDLVIGAARLAGVERLLVPGWNLESSRAALAVVERFPWLDAAVGVHPHDAAAAGAADWAAIRDLARDERVVAVGETGLDYDRMFSPVEAQRENLRRNLDLATDLGKPAILHCRSAAGRRDARDDLLLELDRAGIRAAGRGVEPQRPAAVIHSYSGPIDYAQDVVHLGLAVSFSGLVFRPGEGAGREAARLVPADRVLVETDSPFLSAPGAPRKRNEPQYVSITARWLAEARGEPVDDLGEQLVRAYDFVFGRPASRPS